MTLMEWLRETWRRVGLTAEAMAYDPLDDVRRRIARLEEISCGEAEACRSQISHGDENARRIEPKFLKSQAS